MTDPTIIEMDGSSEPVIVRVAGFEYRFEITHPGDATFRVTETTPDGQAEVLTTGSEW